MRILACLSLNLYQKLNLNFSPAFYFLRLLTPHLSSSLYLHFDARESLAVPIPITPRPRSENMTSSYKLATTLATITAYLGWELYWVSRTYRWLLGCGQRCENCLSEGISKRRNCLFPHSTMFFHLYTHTHTDNKGDGPLMNGPFFSFTRKSTTLIANHCLLDCDRLQRITSLRSRFQWCNSRRTSKRSIEIGWPLCCAFDVSKIEILVDCYLLLTILIRTCQPRDGEFKTVKWTELFAVVLSS